MFVRTKTTEGRTYLQVVESYWHNGRPRQKVIATLGRADKLAASGAIDGMLKSLSRFSDKVRVHEEYAAGRLEAKRVTRIGPDLAVGRLWHDLGIGRVLGELAADRNFSFSLERAVYLATLSRLFFHGSDRRAHRTSRDYRALGTDETQLHHLYRAMAWLGGARERVEDALFAKNRDLFSSLSVVFFDTTSLYFEGAGGETLGRKGYSKDRRPDENQMVLGAVLDDAGRPIAAPMWPGNTTDASTIIPVAGALKERFGVGSVTLVADRGMVGAGNMAELEAAGFSYILGVKMRLERKAMREVLSRAGRFRALAGNLKVKEVVCDGARYIVCVNPEQAKKDAADRSAILAALADKLKGGTKALLGNTGYRRYLRIEKGAVTIDAAKVKGEERYDGKWVLVTNTDMPADEVALRYKELWRVEAVFRDAKSLLQTRPVYHQDDDAIMGHIFVSFLALVLMKELRARLGSETEWDEVRQDLDALYEVEVAVGDKTYLLRSPLRGVAGNVLAAVGVAVPPTVTEAET